MADYAISNVPRRVVYAPSGVGPYAFTFEILDQTDIAVYKGSTLLTLTTDYTVTINLNGTGSVTLVATAGTDNITIVGAKNIQRTSDFTTGGDLFADTLNDELDNQTIFIQQVAETAERGLKAPVIDPTDINMTLPSKTARAGTFLAFDSPSGNPIAGPSIASVGTVTQNIANINTVAADIANVNTVATNIADVNTVAGISTDVSAVADIAADVTTLANGIVNIDAVANDITNINTVATNIASVNTVAGIDTEVTTVAGIDTEVTTVAGISADVSAVAAIDADVTTVAGIDADVTTVAGIDSDVTTVAGIAADVTAVAADATDIGTVATDLAGANNIGTVAGSIADINTLAPIAADITTVAGIDSDVTAVAADATDIGTVAGSIANVNTVAADIADVNTVAGISSDVTTVAGISANVTTVAGIDTEVTAVAGNSTNINTVAGISANVTTVAGISSDVTTVSGISANVTSVAGNATNINTVAGISSDVTTVATNVTDITNYSDTYLGAKATDPTVRNDSSALQAGDLYFNTADDVMKVYSGSAWIAAFVSLSGALIATNNLSDLTNTTTARSNLGLGTAATTSSTDYATAAQGTTADSALQPAAIGVSVQAYDADTAKLDVAQTFTAQQTFEQPIVVPEIIYPVASFSWNSATSSPAKSYFDEPVKLIAAHRNMRRCLLLDNGTVNYYLDENDSTKKADGTAAILTGADGMVMVEVPKFYTKRAVSGTVTTWFVSDYPLTGYTVHPAFIKDGVEVAKRYYSAYDACAFDVSGSAYISGLNRDNAVSNTPNVDVTASTGDVLASVSGIYPMVGLTRAQFRTIAANRGTGWRQLDFALWSAAQLLYLTEYQSFFSQSILGDGNTNDTYLTQSGTQSDSPHTIAGSSNGWGNYSTNGSQPSAGAKPGTAFMVYRGIENLYGNCWNWADGINVNVTSNGNVHVTNNRADFADDTSTNMTLISTTAPTTSGFVSAIAAIDNYFVASSVSGGSATTFLTDQWVGSTSSNRAVRVGSSATAGADSGAFSVHANNASSASTRLIGARLAF
jgi:hypothetical protein